MDWYRKKMGEKFLSKQEITLLNPFFSIKYYSGGYEREDLKIENIFKLCANEDEPTRHCSRTEKNLDLVLEFKEDKHFSLTHFSILGGISCTSPLETGLLFVSDEIPDKTKFQKYNDFTEKKFKEISKKKKVDGMTPVCFFKTNEVSKLFELTFSKLYSGKYIYLKFISSPDKNIDIRQIGLIGLFGEKEKHKNYKFEKKNEIFKKLDKNLTLNRVRTYSGQEWMNFFPCVFLFSENENVKKIIRDIAFYNNDFYFYIVDRESEKSKKLLGVQLHLCLKVGNFKRKDDQLYIIQKDIKTKEEKKYYFKYNKFNKENVIQFFRDFKNNNIEPTIRKEDIPKKEREENGCLHLVLDNFQKTLENAKKDILVSFYTPTIPNFSFENIIKQLPKKYENDKTIDFALYNIDKNDLLKNFSIGLFFFLKGNPKPIRYFTKKIDVKINDITIFINDVKKNKNSYVSPELKAKIPPVQQPIIEKKDEKKYFSVNIQDTSIVFKHYNKFLDAKVVSKSMDEISKIIRSDELKNENPQEIRKLKFILQQKYVQLKNDGRIIIINEKKKIENVVDESLKVIMEEMNVDKRPEIIKIKNENSQNFLFYFITKSYFFSFLPVYGDKILMFKFLITGKNYQTPELIKIMKNIEIK